jgi:hypothetical protein
VLDLGSGYLCNEELPRVMLGFRGLKELRFMAFGANFSEISEEVFEDMIRELSEMKREDREKEIVMRPVEYWEKNERKLASVLEDFYGITEIQKCFLYLIDL